MVKISERIKELRKDKKITQEQLAEIMNVSTGAVCKWEKGLASPDIEKLVDLANFFMVSVDYLLGTKVLDENEKTQSDLIKNKIYEKKLDLSLIEIKSLESKFPNSFSILYYCGKYLYILGIEKEKEEYLRESIQFFKNSLCLYEQNTDEEITRFSINKYIVSAYIYNNLTDQAIEYIKINKLENCESMLAKCYFQKNDYPKSLELFSEDIMESIVNMINSFTCQLTILYKLKKYDDCIININWLISIIEPICTKPNSPFYKLLCLLYCNRSLFSYPNEYQNDLLKAIEMAKKYKTTDSYINHDNIVIYYGKQHQSYSTINDNIMEALEKQIREFDDNDETYKEFLSYFYEQREKNK